MKRTLFAILIFSTTITTSVAQEVWLGVNDKPLNTILNTLGLEVSYNDKALSEYTVTVSRSFDSPVEALYFLLKDKPFRIENIGNVYVIIPAPPTDTIVNVLPAPPVRKSFVFSGVLYDTFTNEPLPYAYIQYNKGVIACNENGFFSIRQSQASVSIKALYIGYEELDTLLLPGHHILKTTPQAVTLDEVVIEPSPAVFIMQSGKTSGEVRVNHQIARYMPGSADNSAFNLLRMLPGVRASGEPSDDLIVWGSNSGDSRIAFDGYTLFGMKNFNDHISSVNPYLAKDIRLLKGGYNATHSNRIGAIAEITGNEGHTDSPVVKAHISNYTGNIYASVPLSERSVLSVAHRRTFYNLYDNENVKLGNKGNEQTTEVYIKPNYSFKDLNIKYTGKAGNYDNYYISLYGADDRFKFSVTQDEQYTLNAKEKNKQFGGATGYNKVWNNGSASKAQVSFSKLSSKPDNVTKPEGSQPEEWQMSHTDNTIQDMAAKVSHTFNAGSWNKVQIGGEWQQYRSTLNGTSHTMNIPTVFVTNQSTLGKLSIETGLRTEFPQHMDMNVQPRISAGYQITESLTATASWGLYRQYISRIPHQYSTGSYQMIWTVNDSIPLKASHTIAGMTYSRNGFLVSIEGYHKRTKNGTYFSNDAIYTAHNTITGGDIYAKKEYKGNTLFASYSLVSVNKPESTTGKEIKTGGIVALKPFYLSFTYIYGTGFSEISNGGHTHGDGQSHGNKEKQHGNNGNNHAYGKSEAKDYNRLDISAVYRHQFKRSTIQTGLSLLNVFDTRNVKYNYQLTDNNNVTHIYTRATPFTPVVFFEVIF